jgi:ribosome-associated toxin RatA of RatAB toxin-antitoxin module
MASIQRTAMVPYTPAEMFSLVDDVPAYPQFLPWCAGAREMKRDIDVVQAAVDIAKAGLHKTFVTENRLQKDKMIEMRLLEGPFNHLHGFWRFEALGDSACKVSLDLRFEFSSTLLALTVGPIFHQIGNTLVDAFCKRAEVVFGKR